MADAEDGGSEVEGLRKQVEHLSQENERLKEELETLRLRCQKLASLAADSTPKAETAEAEAQTEAPAAASDASAGADGGDAPADGEAEAARAPSVVDSMMRSPKDEEVQLRGIEALFAQQTQVDGDRNASGAPALQASLEAAVAVFGNHPGNRTLLLKACQLLSVLLAEPGAQQQLPLAVLWRAAQAVVAVSIQLLADVEAAGSPDALVAAAPGKAGLPLPSPSKLLTWFLSLLALLLPCLGPQLRVEDQSQAFVHDLLANVVSKLLPLADASQQEALGMKCVQLVALLPTERWVQKTSLESGAVHALALVYLRWRRGAAGAGVPPGADVPAPALPKAVQSAVRGVFADNLELCVRALDDTFVSDEFVCLEVVEQLRAMEQKRRGTYRELDKDHGIVGKALKLWAFHQRAALEASDPLSSSSREVLRKVAELLSGVILKLPPQVLLQRMKEFENVEVLQRLCLSAIQTNAQLRLQLAINYIENGVIPVVIGCMQMLLLNYEGGAAAAPAPAGSVEVAFRLLRDDQLPPEGWPYILICLDVFLHVLSHWSATKLSLQKAEVQSAKSAPLQLAQGGLVDTLAEIVDPQAVGVELRERPPPKVLQKATETLQALFEQSGYICLFCMEHYKEVKLMVSLGCESLSSDPLTEYPDMQQQAVSQLVAAFERFSAGDERLGRRILKALTVLFESSYRLVAWFLKGHTLSNLGEYQSLDVHVEAVRAVARAPYWSVEDAPLLPDFVTVLGTLLLDSIEGSSGAGFSASAPSATPRRRILDLTESEEVVAACMTSVLHLLLIDPRPPSVLRGLAAVLARHGQAEGKDVGEPDPKEDPEADDANGVGGFEEAVNAVMRVMQVFPSSDRVQMNCQHLLTSLLGG